MLGILFGVCAVIATLAVVEGISHRMQEEVLKMGATNIIVEAVKPPEDQSASARQQGAALAYGLTYEDAERIQSSVVGADVVVPARKIRVPARYHARGTRATVLGTVPWYLDTYGLKVAAGRWLMPVDLRKTSNVCVLGSAVAADLFPREDPMDASVRLGDDYYRVIGILASRGTRGARRRRQSRRRLHGTRHFHPPDGRQPPLRRNPRRPVRRHPQLRDLRASRDHRQARPGRRRAAGGPRHHGPPGEVSRPEQEGLGGSGAARTPGGPGTD